MDDAWSHHDKRVELLSGILGILILVASSLLSDPYTPDLHAVKQSLHSLREYTR